VVAHLHAQGKKVLFAPDRHLGHYIQSVTGADMLIWDGACIVHEEFKADGLRQLMAEHPEAAVLVHPESPAAVIELADRVGSTTQIIHSARDMPNRKFIVATDQGILHTMQKAVPDKELIIAPTAGHGATCYSCANCPWMAMNELESLATVFDRADNEVFVEPELGRRAMLPLQRMLDFKKTL
jgi:quinolinate synthase